MYPQSGAAGGVAQDPVEQVADAAQPGGVHPAGLPAPRMPGVRGGHGLGQVSLVQRVPRKVTELAHVVIGAGVVAAGPDEAAAVVRVHGDLVAAPRQPGQDGAGLPELVAEIGRHAGRGRGPFRLRRGLGQDLLPGRRAARGQGQGHRRGPGPGQRPLPGQGGAAARAHFAQALRQDRLDMRAGPHDRGAELVGQVHGGHASTVRVTADSVILVPVSCERVVTGALGWVTIGERPRHRDACRAPGPLRDRDH